MKNGKIKQKTAQNSPNDITITDLQPNTELILHIEQQIYFHSLIDKTPGFKRHY